MGRSKTQQAQEPNPNLQPETNDVSFVPQVEVKQERTVSKTDSGIYKVEEKITSKRPHFVKKIDSESYAVVSELGETIRIYTKEKGCEDPKASAESFARKMSLRWI